MANPQESKGGAPQKIRLEAWTWPKAFLVVFGICIFSWGIGSGVRNWAGNDWKWSTSTTVFVISGVVAAVSFILMSWRAVLEFFLSIRVGVAILVFFALGSIISVLIPPRDPEKYKFIEKDHRMVEAALEEQESRFKDDFAWATGYFFYHLSHPYGFGLPNAKLPFEDGGKDANNSDSPIEAPSRPSNVKNPLERIAGHYGDRLARQEESGMRSALTGRVRTVEIQDYIKKNRDFFDGFYELSKKLQLSGTPTSKGAWASDWFSMLTAFLFIVILANTFRRGIARSIAQGNPGLGFVKKLPSALLWDLKTLITKERIGFFVTHLGIMTAIGGGFWSRLTEERGVVQLSISPRSEGFPNESYQFQTYNWRRLYFGTPDKTFAVRLARFHADYRDTLDVTFLEDPPPRTVPKYRYYEVWNNRQIGLEYNEKGLGEPNTVVKILEHYPRSNVEFDLAERSDGDAPSNTFEANGAALKVKFNFSGDLQEGFLVSGDEFLSVFDKTPGVRIRYESAVNAKIQNEKLQAPYEGDRLGVIHVILASDPTRPAVSVPISKEGSFTFKTPKGEAKVKIHNALPDARLVGSISGELTPAFERLDPAMVPPLHGGVLLEIRDAGGKLVKSEWYYENEADSLDEDRGLISLDGTRARIMVDWDHWRSPAFERYRMVSAPGEPVKIVKIGETNASEVKVGEIITLQNGMSFVVNRRAERPKLVPIITPITGDADDGELFFDNSPPAARIQVAGPAGKVEYLIAGVPFADTAIYDKRMAIRLFENTTEFPKEWKSKLEFLEVDPATKQWIIKDTQTIRVNDYAYYRGFRFFQTDANKQMPGYSGVGVVFDPGIETVIYGLWAVVIGVAYVFLVKPFFRKAAVS